MIPEYGHFALILSLCVAVALAILPLWGAYVRNTVLMRSASLMSQCMFWLLTFSFACLVYAFWTDDFSVAYVVANSNRELPKAYKVSAVWSAHEGSLLLWVWLLAAWTAAVSVFSRQLPLEMISRVLSVMGFIAVGFLAFTLFTSNPFSRHLPFFPADGGDLNPLLQDFGLIIHPPTLYLGYVGFSVAFAFAIAALLGGSLDSSWARWTRPWTLMAWAFLTLGIALGSWWAYYELGWGGWWFWDPVENASFMPWLVGTALIHSLSASEKRGVFKSWTLLLAIFAFSLSLLGTFLVRSGVLTSVHAFASDPERGYFILVFLAIVIGGSLTLYALRAPLLKSTSSFATQSKESALLVNNLFLVVIMLIVLLGTLYPLLADALQWGKISVGPPYFNLFFIPLMAILLLILPLGVMMKWKKDNIASRKQALIKTFCASVVFSVVFIWFYSRDLDWQGVLGVLVPTWVVLLTAMDMIYQTRHADNFMKGLSKLSRSYKGMVLAHIGMALCAAGVSLSSVYSQSMDLRMEPGQQSTLADYNFVFMGTQAEKGPNYLSSKGEVKIYRGDKLIAHLFPEKRRYNSDRGNAMTEAGIDPGFWRDLYVSMGEPLGETLNGPWAMRLHYKPFVRWIWLGALFMAAGATLSVLDKRYRLMKYAKA